MQTSYQDTIAAIATPPGKGGVGIVRVSGPQAQEIGHRLLGKADLKPRYAHYGSFYEASDDGPRSLDQGIALYFPGPNSFTGEDVLELQGHGGPIILDCLLREVIKAGARIARPGEFSERAFLNNKIDLAQAEAIADLIDSASEQAARQAVRSLEGEFSKEINQLVEAITQLRIYVEAAIDFPEEEIDFISDGRVASELSAIKQNLERVFASAKQGSILREGMTVVIAGRPNAGKSSLLNALAGRESAIVTNIAGTTRDVLRENILIDGMPLHIIDTAGLRDSEDLVEQEGIKRAWTEIANADRILLVIDSQTAEAESDAIPSELQPFIDQQKLSIIYNKCDLSGHQVAIDNSEISRIYLSAKHAKGIDLLREHLKSCVGYNDGDTPFIARRRHIEALNLGREHIHAGEQQLLNYNAGELLAEELRIAQQALAEITGEFSSDDLLGRIFSSFCIGK
ncbi:tRNA modification GTPase TrmE [gamma proteobacterium BDW918]|jgi:tRNA modification GTPase|uniref:tRNA modification GTPase MnmE n=1 Tax=Zhongshania aliphaticivorans TaxID=1470434 RepID=A0A127MAK9_9GAMM|nr:tRNA uridine-5-carboxymethylaminomethyl(34) synthesis GTPase MnmE [Zhongshania aliphaticivorans]AMO70208.1 tRNA modification GTPase MnmE [Zhongshania aliphaticivorans]EIF41419.1 tRNA modification GTPase TrmE [gamma proteobacterium BDW918]|tara:strand:- start:14762 stop:16129 length:1368 start_codon:yes stop_codon:yes gene_type:complete